jgi:hypothetical protein
MAFLMMIFKTRVRFSTLNHRNWPKRTEVSRKAETPPARYREHAAFTAKARSVGGVWLLAKLCDAMRQSGNLSASSILVNDAFLGRPHNDGLAIIKRRLGARAIARSDGFFDLDHRRAQA